MIRKGALAGALCLSAACAEVPEDPEGPLRVTRMTLFDQTSRDQPVFSDTSAPLDCQASPEKEGERCTTDPFKDRYGVRRSPPTPDSGQQIRVVFNKLPLRIRGMDIERITRGPDRLPTDIQLSDRSAIALLCDRAAQDPCATPPVYLANTALAGATFSPDPTTFAYGPALQIEVHPDEMSPLAALEPGTAYEIALSADLADRADNRIEINEATRRLLRFSTERFQVLQVGVGDPDHDAWVYAADAPEKGTAAAPYRVADVPLDGVIALRLNAALDDSVWQAGSVSARAAGKEIPAALSVNQLVEEMGKAACDPGDQRAIYVAPKAMDGRWGDLPEGTELTITLRGADVRDVSQAPGHPAGMGRHTLSGSGDIVIVATLTGKVADEKYAGLVSSGVREKKDCP